MFYSKESGDGGRVSGAVVGSGMTGTKKAPHKRGSTVMMAGLHEIRVSE